MWILRTLDLLNVALLTASAKPRPHYQKISISVYVSALKASTNVRRQTRNHCLRAQKTGKWSESCLLFGWILSSPHPSNQMRPLFVLCLVGFSLLSVCAVQAQEDPWQKFLREDRERSSQEKAAREARLERADKELEDARRALRPTPMVVPTQRVQPSSGNPVGEQYQTIMVNTPNGLVYKRCKVLDGKAVVCF